VAVGLASSPPVAVAWRAKQEKKFLGSPGVDHALKLFKCYIDDSGGIWQEGRNTFDCFAASMNQVNPNLKYTGEEGSSITMLDTRVALKDGHIQISMYRKPISNPQALSYNSCHPRTCKDAIPAAALQRICRLNSDRVERLSWMEDAKTRFEEAGYPTEIIQEAWDKVINKSQQELLQRSTGNEEKEKAPFYVTTYHPALQPTASTMNKRFEILKESEHLKKIFKRPPIKAWKRGTNVKEILCPSRLLPLQAAVPTKGFYRCNKERCKLCPFAMEMTSFTINGASRKIYQNLNCQSTKGIYVISCNLCHQFYIGRTAETLETRFRGHKADINSVHSQKTLAKHFQGAGHNLERDMRMFMFLSSRDWKRLADLESEAIAFFKTQHHGLNQRE
jgi:hypothetical protein